MQRMLGDSDSAELDDIADRRLIKVANARKTAPLRVKRGVNTYTCCTRGLAVQGARLVGRDGVKVKDEGGRPLRSLGTAFSLSSALAQRSPPLRSPKHLPHSVSSQHLPRRCLRPCPPASSPLLISLSPNIATLYLPLYCLAHPFPVQKGKLHSSPQPAFESRHLVLAGSDSFVALHTAFSAVSCGAYLLHLQRQERHTAGWALCVCLFSLPLSLFPVIPLQRASCIFSHLSVSYFLPVRLRSDVSPQLFVCICRHYFTSVSFQVPKSSPFRLVLAAAF